MEEVIISPFIPSLFLLIYIQVTREAHFPHAPKPGQHCGSKITVVQKQIFTDNHNWTGTDTASSTEGREEKQRREKWRR